MERYAGKPFLRLLECYVLRCMGQLDPSQEEKLRQMEPKLRGIYGHDGPWHAVVADQMQLADAFPVQVKALWDRFSAEAQANHVVADPEAFVREFVDRNLA